MQEVLAQGGGGKQEANYPAWTSSVEQSLARLEVSRTAPRPHDPPTPQA